MHERERKRLESRSQVRAYSQDIGPETLATTRLWMERTRWAITYNRIRRDVLQAFADVCVLASGGGSQELDASTNFR
jgi:hypothetical protein